MDDTKKYGKRMELYSGKDFQIEFWEQCLGTMLIGEVASFMVPPRCLLSFPAVNKKLRDYMLDKGAPGSAGGPPKHTCGFMSLREQGGLGYPDLDDLMTNPKTLEFIFELISESARNARTPFLKVLTPLASQPTTDICLSLTHHDQVFELALTQTNADARLLSVCQRYYSSFDI
ncbi:unnamed protein product [Dibothriocephalus latus]|uniref:AIP/AIPL N-terminal FKBP-type PPIase domain-containing protein n=1 Tax=Dibothriocephalus latus TaxID=60516 RepID=A0A3P6TZ32_DIBLA|nr:unnamed protein product [Dibothriocephalus latus]